MTSEKKKMVRDVELSDDEKMVESIAHQWRQPLNTLILILSNLEDKYELNELNDEQFKLSIDKSRELIKQMAETIDDFRHFNSENIKREIFFATEVAKEVKYHLEDKLNMRNVQLDILREDGIILCGRKNQYYQALFNVIDNSIDALVKNKKDNRWISINIYYENRYIIYEVEDNAGGVENKELKSLFDIYFSTKIGKKGTGLGLYISKNIVEKRLGGKIECYNTENGLMTKISIPKQRGDETFE